MADKFFHGVEVQEVTSGSRPIQTIRTSVIGLVGTAPDAAPDVKATLSIGTAAANNGLIITSKLAGIAGNEISISLVNPAGNSQSLSVEVEGHAITVSLATGATGTITTTAATLKSAIEGDTDAHALIGVAALGASTGAGVVAAAAAAKLGGGVNEPFPLNTPILIAGNLTEAARFGSTGTIPEALRGIFAQIGAVVVVVRVAEGENLAATTANVIGGVDDETGQYEGVSALLGAESRVGLRPGILIAPGFTHQRTDNQSNPVAAAMLIVAERLRSVMLIDGPNTNDDAAKAAAADNDSGRAYLIDPWLTNLADDGSIVNIPPSAAVAGLIAKIDDQEGWWVSPSNHVIRGFTGLSRPVDYTQGDANSRANLLNEAKVTTFIRDGGGLRLWGNRTLASDPRWAFLCVRRIADAINESVQRGHQWAVDRNITRTYVEDVTESVNAYLRQLTALGAILGGECWADGELNNPMAYAQGKVFFNFRFTPTAPAEHIIFRSHVTNDYVTELFQ